MTADTPAPRRFSIPLGRYEGAPVSMEVGEFVIIANCLFRGQSWSDPAQTTYQVIGTDQHPEAGLRYILQNTAHFGQVIEPATGFIAL